MSDSVEWVEVKTVADPMAATLLRQALEAEGIAVFVHGEHHAALVQGMMGGYVQPRILVPAADAERARELIEELEAGGYTLVDPAAPQELGDDEEPEDPPAVDLGPYRTAGPPAAEAPRARAPRRRLVAAILPLVFPSAGCIYTGQTVTAMTLLAGLFSTSVALGVRALLPAWLLTIWCDAALAVTAVASVNRGESVPKGRQLLMGGLCWALMTVIGLPFTF